MDALILAVDALGAGTVLIFLFTFCLALGGLIAFGITFLLMWLDERSWR